MNFKKIRKDIVYFLGWAALSGCSLIISVLPEAWLYSFAKAIASLGYTFARKQRNIAFESLSFAFGDEKTQAEKEQIARDCFMFMSKSAAELLFLMDKPNILEKQVSFTGEENLRQALAKGSGVILVSAHFGNFPLMLGRLAIAGYKTAAIMRQMKDTRVEKMFLKKRQRYNIKTIYSQPRKACVDTTIRFLRDNGLVFIPIDQNFGTSGVFVDFFGKKAATATGPVVLASRTKAAIIPCFIIRQKDDTHNIVFEKQVDLEQGEGDQETIAINIQKLTGIIESYIRRYPAEWGWIHRRWKTKPKVEGGA